MTNVVTYQRRPIPLEFDQRGPQLATQVVRIAHSGRPIIALITRPITNDHMVSQTTETYLYDQFLALNLSDLPTKPAWLYQVACLGHKAILTESTEI